MYVKVENLHSELHDGIDNIGIVILESFDSLSSRASGLTNNQLDILRVKAGLYKRRKTCLR